MIPDWADEIVEQVRSETDLSSDPSVSDNAFAAAVRKAKADGMREAGSMIVQSHIDAKDHKYWGPADAATAVYKLASKLETSTE